MKRRLERHLRDWLAAEANLDEERGDRSLTAAFACVPRRDPRSGFADRVLVAAGVVRTVPSIWRARWLHATIAACLIACGFAVAAAPAVFTALLPLVSGFGLSLASRAWHVAVGSLSLSLASWRILEDLTVAVRAALMHPAGMAVVLANVVMAAAIIAGLKRLLRFDEEMMQC